MSGAWESLNPEDLAVFTVEEVLNGKSPVLYVGHEVSDGMWHFSGSGEVTGEQLRLVPLADVVKRDASLDELADLPLGWFAERETREAPWVRQPSYSAEWDELSEMARQYASECQEHIVEEFSLEKWERFDYSEETASLVFSSAGKPRVGMTARVVGSWSERDKTWLWSWANDRLLPEAVESMQWLRLFGEQHGFERLKTPRWPAEQADGWEMACIACLLLQGEGVYRAPDGDGALFLVMSEPEFADE